MKLTLRSNNRVRIVLLEDRPQYLGVAANDPHVFTPLDLKSANQQKSKGLQDVPVLYRGDTVPLDVTLLDYRGNPFTGLNTAVSITLGVKKLVPVPGVLFTLAGSLVDALTGLVLFTLTPTHTNQVDVDESIANVRVETSAGVYVTFETFPIQFLNSSFT